MLRVVLCYDVTCECFALEQVHAENLSVKEALSWKIKHWAFIMENVNGLGQNRGPHSLTAQLQENLF